MSILKKNLVMFNNSLRRIGGHFVTLLQSWYKNKILFTKQCQSEWNMIFSEDHLSINLKMVEIFIYWIHSVLKYLNTFLD